MLEIIHKVKNKNNRQMLYYDQYIVSTGVHRMRF